LIVTCPFPTGKYPGFTSTIYRLIPILFNKGINPNLILSKGGDLLTSVPPFILIYLSNPRPVTTGTKHCIINVQLAAVAAKIYFGYKNFG